MLLHAFKLFLNVDFWSRLRLRNVVIHFLQIIVLSLFLSTASTDQFTTICLTGCDQKTSSDRSTVEPRLNNNAYKSALLLKVTLVNRPCLKSDLSFQVKFVCPLFENFLKICIMNCILIFVSIYLFYRQYFFISQKKIKTTRFHDNSSPL